jgi:DNA-directed RNA polymerase specialized sigma24 family protein
VPADPDAALVLIQAARQAVENQFRSIRDGRQALRDQEREAVRAARRLGYSWAQIADRLDTVASNVWTKYHDLDTSRRAPT